MSRDGTQILINSESGRLALWNYDTGEGLAWKQDFPLDCRHVAGPDWAPDGQSWLVGADRRVVLMTIGGETRELHPHDQLVTSVAFSPDGRWAATSGSEGLVRLYETATWTSRELRGHQGRVSALAFAPDGATLGSVGLDGTLRLWDLISGESKLVHSWGSAPLYSLAFHPDGDELAIGGDAGRLYWCRAPRPTSIVPPPSARPSSVPLETAVRNPGRPCRRASNQRSSPMPIARWPAVCRELRT